MLSDSFELTAIDEGAACCVFVVLSQQEIVRLGLLCCWPWHWLAEPALFGCNSRARGLSIDDSEGTG